MEKDCPVPTSDRLRIDIDRGLTADKVAWPDPAAAPLGTDDEAGGAPPTPEQCALAAEQVRKAKMLAEPEMKPADWARLRTVALWAGLFAFSLLVILLGAG